MNIPKQCEHHRCNMLHVAHFGWHCIPCVLGWPDWKMIP